MAFGYAFRGTPFVTYTGGNEQEIVDFLTGFGNAPSVTVDGTTATFENGYYTMVVNVGDRVIDIRQSGVIDPATWAEQFVQAGS